MTFSYKTTLFVFIAIAALIGLFFIFLGGDVQQYWRNDWAGDSTGVLHPQASSTAQYDFISTVPQQFIATGCDNSLWQHNAEDEKVSAPCIHLTGVVEKVKPEDDGDMNIQLKPDPQYAVLLNSYNIKNGSGDIGLEPICVVSPVRPAFIKSCKGYINQVTIPTVGMHIGVTGSYGQDQHLWMEIHPVTSITVL